MKAKHGPAAAPAIAAKAAACATGDKCSAEEMKQPGATQALPVGPRATPDAVLVLTR